MADGDAALRPRWCGWLASTALICREAVTPHEHCLPACLPYAPSGSRTPPSRGRAGLSIEAWCLVTHDSLFITHPTAPPTLPRSIRARSSRVPAVVQSCVPARHACCQAGASHAGCGERERQRQSETSALTSCAPHSTLHPPPSAPPTVRTPHRRIRVPFARAASPKAGLGSARVRITNAPVSPGRMRGAWPSGLLLRPLLRCCCCWWRELPAPPESTGVKVTGCARVLGRHRGASADPTRTRRLAQLPAPATGSMEALIRSTLLHAGHPEHKTPW